MTVYSEPDLERIEQLVEEMIPRDQWPEELLKLFGYSIDDEEDNQTTI